MAFPGDIAVFLVIWLAVYAIVGFIYTIRMPLIFFLLSGVSSAIFIALKFWLGWV